MPSLRSAWVWVDMSPPMDSDDTAQNVVRPIPCAGTIKTVRVVQQALGAAGSASFVLSNTGVNVLSAASCSCATDLTAATPEDLVLTTQTGSLQVVTTGYLNAVYTLTTCSYSTSAIGVRVAIEPSDYW